MDLNVFVCQGGYLLSPDCMLVPQRATEDFWPVSAVLGVVDCRELPEEICDRVLGDIDAKQFSFMGNLEALRLGVPNLASLRPYAPTGNLHPRRQE